WFARACANEPAQRFQSARELADALFTALGIFDVASASATGSLPAVTADGAAPSDAPSVPGLNASAYNYATGAEPPPRRRRAVIAGAIALLTVVIGFAVFRTRATPEPQAPHAAAAPPKAEPEKTVAPTPTPSITAPEPTSEPAKSAAPKIKSKPKTTATVAAPKADGDPFG